LINDKNEIDYDELKRQTDAIESGRARLDRFLVQKSGEEKGFDRRNEEASLIVGSDDSAGKAASGELTEREIKERRKSDEALIEAYARKEGIWLDYKKETSKKMIDRGRESQVYPGEVVGTVRKLGTMSQFKSREIDEGRCSRG
jgi:hypothetical protein